jgi:hypothetical protein
MFPRLASMPFAGFRDDLDAAEQAASVSSSDWAVREADLERRLAALEIRASKLSRRAAPKKPRRDPVVLYSSRWSQRARMSLLLAD